MRLTYRQREEFIDYMVNEYELMDRPAKKAIDLYLKDHPDGKGLEIPEMAKDLYSNSKYWPTL